MTTSVCSRQFLESLICSGILRGLHSAVDIRSRLYYIFFTVFLAATSLVIKQNVSRLPQGLLSLIPCKSCLADLIVHTLMLSSALFNFLILLSSQVSPGLSVRCYKSCWPVKILVVFLMIPTFFLLLVKFVSFIQDFYFWTGFMFAGMFVSVIGIYSVEMFYDWNDTWYENYSQTGSATWAALLVLSSVTCWVINVFLLARSYYSESFIYVAIYFLSSAVLSALSSSSICENGCKTYSALLSCSASVTLGLFFFVSGVSRFESNWVDISFCLVWSSGIMTYFAYTHSEQLKAEHTQINTTEMKNFKDLEETKIEETNGLKEKMRGSLKFQVFMIGFSVYLGMVLTGWKNEAYSSIREVVSAGLGVICFLFYIWTLVVPIVFPDQVLPNNN